MKAVQYANDRLNLLKKEMGSIQSVDIIDNGLGLGIVIEFSNGMTLRLHNEEIKHQALMHLASEMEEIKN
jgi:hypothetical protein